MADTDEPASFMTTTDSEIFTVGSPSKFDITTFPNASRINVKEKKTKHEKVEPPNARLRSLQNVPKPMKIPEDEEDDIVINTQDTEAITKSIENYANPSKLHKILRYVATALALIVQLLIFIAMCVARTATAYSEASGTDGVDATDIKCSWLFLSTHGTKSKPEAGGALVCLLFVLIAFILNVWAIIYVQPYKIKQRLCFPAYYPRIIFSGAFLCILIAIITFAAGDNICYANKELSELKFKLGASLNMIIVALVLELPCCVIAM